MGESSQIDRLAARQHGVFNRRQARDAGFDHNAVGRRLDNGTWLKLDHSVYCVASAKPTWMRQLWAAFLSRPRALIGGRSAAALHGLEGFGPGRPVIVVPGSANARSNLARVIRAEYFDQIETVRIGGLPVTSVEETIVTLASDLTVGKMEKVLDEAILSGTLRVEVIQPIIERELGRRRKGIVSLRDLVEERAPWAPSVDSTYLEALLEKLLAGAPIPQWEREHPFTIGGVSSRVDVYVRLWSLVIEADGRAWHARVAAYETDRARDNALAAQGIQVIRLTYKMLTEDSEGCLATILQTGRVRSA